MLALRSSFYFRVFAALVLMCFFYSFLSVGLYNSTVVQAEVRSKGISKLAVLSLLLAAAYKAHTEWRNYKQRKEDLPGEIERARTESGRKIQERNAYKKDHVDPAIKAERKAAKTYGDRIREKNKQYTKKREAYKKINRWNELSESQRTPEERKIYKQAQKDYDSARGEIDAAERELPSLEKAWDDAKDHLGDVRKKEGKKIEAENGAKTKHKNLKDEQDGIDSAIEGAKQKAEAADQAVTDYVIAMAEAVKDALTDDSPVD